MSDWDLTSNDNTLSSNPDRIEYLNDLREFRAKWPEKRLYKVFKTSRQALDYHKKKGGSQ